MTKKRFSWRRMSALLTAVALTAGGFFLSPAQRVSAETKPEEVLEAYSSKQDIATQLYSDRKATGMTFTGVEYENDSYNLTFTGNYAENEDVTYEGLRFIVATAQEVVKGRKVEIHLNVRDNNLYIWARPVSGAPETGLLYGVGLLEGKKGEDNQYAIRYDHGKIWFFENGRMVLDGFDLAGDEIPGETERYCNVGPKIELTSEACANKLYSNLRLWGNGVKYAGLFPAIPEGNGDYGTTTAIRPIKGSSTEYENGVLTNQNTCTDLVQFKHLPFQEDDTFAWSFEMTVEEADQTWKGVRPIIRADKDFKEYYQLLFEQNGVLLNYHNDYTKKEYTVTTASYGRTLGKADKVDMVIRPDSVSLWINGLMVMDRIPLENKVPANVGMKYEFTKAVIRDLSFYYTEKTPYVVPEGDPVMPVMTKDMYNAAQYMVVSGANGPVSYQNYRLKSDELHYNFSNIPISEYGEYVFRADVTQYSEWSEPWKGTRIKFRTGESGDYYIYFLRDSLMIAGVPDATYPVKIEVGRTYDIAILSNVDTVTVWLDGKLVFDRVDLSATGGKTKPATGIWFELCDAVVENMKIYGKDIVFTEDTFDVRLKNDKWFNMTTVPEKPEGGVNYFQNVKFGSGTNMDILPVYENGVFTNKFSDLDTTIVFVDQENSHNLNGLKNSDTYVWSSKVKANSFSASYKDEQGNVVKDVGIGYIFKNTTHPGNGGGNYMGLYLLQDRLELRCYKDKGIEKCFTNSEFALEVGREYKVDMLIGSGWAKVWVDDQLMFTTYDLPVYNLAFQLAIVNSEMEVSDIEVYTVESGDAQIREVKAEENATKAGNTISSMKASVLPLAGGFRGQPLAFVLFAIPVAGLMAFAGVMIYRKVKRGSKKEKGGPAE